MQKREKNEDPPNPFSALPDVLMDKIVEKLNDKEVRALASTNKTWNRPMLQCLGSAVGGQSTFDTSQCTGRAYYHPDTVRATLLCALPARSLPGSRRVEPLHLYVNKDLIDTCDNDSRVRCFVDARLPLRVTLLYPLDVDVNKPESMTEQASEKPTDLPTVAGVRPTRALVVGKGSENGFIIKDSKPCEHDGCTKLAVFRKDNMDRGRYCEDHKKKRMIHIDDDSFGKTLDAIEYMPSEEVSQMALFQLFEYRTFAALHTMGFIYRTTRNFETVRFDKEPIYIGSSAFLCSNIVEFPPMPKLGRIHNQAFYASSGLDTLGEMPLLCSIGKCAFDGCKSLEHLPSTFNNLEKIEPGAFRWCEKLQTLPNMPKLTHIHDQAFRECTALQRLPDMPALTTIGKYAFYQNTQLEQLGKMPKLTTIGEGAFCGCTRLKAFHLSGSIRHIGNRAFYNCPKLNVTIEPRVSFEELVCNDLKIREAFQNAALPLPNFDDDLEGEDDDDNDDNDDNDDGENDYLENLSYYPEYLPNIVSNSDTSTVISSLFA